MAYFMLHLCIDGAILFQNNRLYTVASGSSECDIRQNAQKKTANSNRLASKPFYVKVLGHVGIPPTGSTSALRYRNENWKTKKSVCMNVEMSEKNQ